MGLVIADCRGVLWEWPVFNIGTDPLKLIQIGCINGEPTAITISEDCKLMAIGCAKGIITIWDRT